jgi:hypothetical protein
MTSLGRNWCRWEESIIFTFKKWEGMLWTGLIWLWIGSSGMLLRICHEASGSIKDRIFLDYLRNYWLFKALFLAVC